MHLLQLQMAKSFRAVVVKGHIHWSHIARHNRNDLQLIGSQPVAIRTLFDQWRTYSHTTGTCCLSKLYFAI